MPDDGAEAYPLLSDRRNIVFIADEAHRSQYGLEARKPQNGRNQLWVCQVCPRCAAQCLVHRLHGNACETTDANTRLIFGDYIDIYDIQRAVDDGATVPIYYEARLARIKLHEDQRPVIDPTFEEITEGEEDTVKERLKSKWARLEAMVRAEDRLAQVAQDIVTHFESRLSALDGKGMIVCMSRQDRR